MLWHCKKSKDTVQIKLFFRELSDLISLCPIPFGCLNSVRGKDWFWEWEKWVCFNHDLFKLQTVDFTNPKMLDVQCIERSIFIFAVKSYIPLETVISDWHRWAAHCSNDNLSYLFWQLFLLSAQNALLKILISSLSDIKFIFSLWYNCQPLLIEMAWQTIT